jgi:hyperosmotically inducible protein
MPIWQTWHTCCISDDLMKSMNLAKMLMILGAATLLNGVSAFANDNPNSPALVDNSVKNVSDRDNRSVTPMNQSEDAADLKITTRIRRAIIRDKSLSVDAHNIKIITTKDHVVYLRGPVANDNECKKIESIAKANAGVYPVKNELRSKTTGN